MKRSEGNYRMATTFQAKYARKVFDPATVAAAIDNRAIQGHRHYRIVQKHPFDLSETDAAKALEEWLDREQFHYTWRPTLTQEDILRPASVMEYPELLVSW